MGIKFYSFPILIYNDMIKYTKKSFIKKSKEIHGDKYDYSLVEYVNTNIKVKIICKEHEVFEQKPSKHIYNKQGCPKCANNIKKTTEQFIKESKQAHGDKYNYSLVDYKGSYIKVKIICHIHGIFNQIPHNHLKPFGCPKCANNIKKTTEQFIKESKQVHGDKYNYSLVDYKKNDIVVKIICPIHGIFEQTPTNHLKYCNCPKCNSSKGEKKIRKYLIDNNLIYKEQHKFNNCMNKRLLKFDFYLPDFNICIEFDGIQHYKIKEFFGGVNGFKEIQKNDKIKSDYCKKNNIYLLRIKYIDFKNIESVLDNNIKTIK